MSQMTSATIDALAAQFCSDGVIHVPGLLDPAMLELARAGFEWTVANPSPAAQHLFPGAGGLFYQDLFNTASWPHYLPLLEQGPLAALMARLWGSQNVWFFFEQVFMKSGPSRRTPWHQDTSYFPVEGADMAVVWISLEAVAAQYALEFVRGSHRDRLFNGAAFTGEDDTAPLYDAQDMPRLPDIEAQRDRFDILSWPVVPGDALIFHPSTLHGGGDILAGGQRRTLSLRFFGDDCRFVARPKVSGASAVGFNRENSKSRNVEEFYEGLAPGDAFRHPDFIHLVG
jgi:ectoine hydroxylase-related dioxygenase (phytanoyl-CoA dioxygenase family)